MAQLRPGKAARGSTTGRPIMVALDLLGRRWTLKLLWELRDGALSFRNLQAQSQGLSPSVLNTRLRELREARIVELTEDGYALSEQGRALIVALTPLYAWAKGWARGFRG